MLAIKRRRQELVTERPSVRPLKQEVRREGAASLQ